GVVVAMRGLFAGWCVVPSWFNPLWVTYQRLIYGMNRRRWLVVLGALLVQPCLGAIYGWGVFVPALKASRSELTVTLSPQVLGVDRTAHAAVLSDYKLLKKRLAEAHSAERAAAKSGPDGVLAEDVPRG